MRTIDGFRNSANESAAFVNGFTDGQAARAGRCELSAYVRVGIDDYAKGYRAGYFARSASGDAVDGGGDRQVVNL